MKKSILMLVCLFSSFFASATFVPPGSYPETTYPTAAMSVVSRPVHVCAYEMDNVMFYGTPNNLFLYSWCGGAAGISTPNVNGFAWKRTNPGGAMPVHHFGQEIIPGVIFDLEVGFVQVGTDTYIVAVYYENGVGHKYRIYRWLPGIAGVSIWSSGTLSSSASYGRISLDVHRLYGVAITWEVAGRIFVKTMNTTGGTLAVGAARDIAGITSGAIPDVAFAHADDLLVRISYVNKTSGDIHTINNLFSNLMVGTGTTTFATDDINAASFPSTIGAWYADNLQLDCPDHHTEDSWSYIYSDNDNDVFSRTYTPSYSSSPFISNLTGWLGAYNNKYLTLAYAPGGTKIHYGWYTNYTAYSPIPGYIVREYSDIGIPSSTFPKIVTTAPSYSSISVMAFSKQNDWSSRLFAVYSMVNTGGLNYEMRYKTVPWTAASFRPGNATSTEEIQNENVITVIPNPFTNHIAINIAGDNGKAIYSTSITDIQGRVLLNTKGTLENINQQLAKWSSGSAKAGLYFIQLQETNGKIHRSFKVVKQ